MDQGKSPHSQAGVGSWPEFPPCWRCNFVLRTADLTQVEPKTGECRNEKAIDTTQETLSGGPRIAPKANPNHANSERKPSQQPAVRKGTGPLAYADAC
jgi:hypothetical protein